MVLEEASYLVTGFIPIHDRHVAVHQYQIICCHGFIIFLDVFNYFLKGLEPVLGCVANILWIYELDWIFEDDHGSVDVEVLIIHYQDPLLVILLGNVSLLRRASLYFVPYCCIYFLLGLLYLVLNAYLSNLVVMHLKLLVSFDCLGWLWLPLKHKVGLVQMV